VAQSASILRTILAASALFVGGSVWAAEVPLFTDVTEESGILFSVSQSPPVTGVGIAVMDLDGDDALDLILAGGTDLPITAYRNMGGMKFVEVGSEHTGLGSLVIDPRGMMAADYDNDGDADLFIAEWEADHPCRLLRNDGGTFVDVTAEAGVLVIGDATGGAWGDFDNDGWLDLHVGRYWGQQNRLFRNNQDGTFSDVTVSSGLDAPVLDEEGMVYPGSQTFQTAWMDVDRDGDVDLLEINDRCYNGFARNLIWVNQGDGTFVEDGHAFGFGHCFDGMGLGLGDADRDGFLDAYITNVPDGHFFLQGGCDGWTDVSEASGTQAFQWGWGVLFEDFNHDAWPDLYVAHAGYISFDTENALYLNEGDWVFSEVAMQSDAWGGNHDSGVVVQADWDGDGDADILINHLYDSPYTLLRNDGPTGHWLTILLEGVASNRDGLGAWVDVLAGGVWQRRLRHEATAFKGRSDPALRFGLGDSSSVQRVVVRWPSGAVQVLEDVMVDQRLTIVEEDTGGAPAAVHSERCGDGIDNDCDGEIDEGFDLGGSCVVGVGACQAPGVLGCDYAGYGTFCEGTPLLPVDEIGGDGIDNDCDGDVDEVVIVPECNGTLELCGDGIDNDCDGSTDEGFPPFATACEVGVGACRTAGIWQCSADGLEAHCTAEAAPPATEACGDGIDNDCDGETDEGFSFGFSCVASLGTCAVAGETGCGPEGDVVCIPGPEESWVELCGDAVDNDCDGHVDEGFPAGAVCWSGEGACRRKGTMVCTADELGVECDATPGEPGDEIAHDGFDNDCDGLIDEDASVDAEDTGGSEDTGAAGGGGALAASDPGGCAASPRGVPSPLLWLCGGLSLALARSRRRTRLPGAR